MKIRWKILLILLAFSLLPLILMRIHGINTLTSLGKDLQAQTRTTLLERTVEDLTHLANGIAEIINLEDRLYRTSLKSVQLEAEQRLLGQNSKDRTSNPFVIWPGGKLNEPELTSDPNYKTLMGMGQGSRGGMNRSRMQGSPMMGMQGDRSFQDLPISRNDISFWLPEGLSLEDTRSSIDRIESMLPLFKSCDETLSELILWIEITLESGLTATYPAHMSFPRRYDPRISQWYRQLRKDPKLDWSLPSTDPATRSLAYRLAAPITDKVGNFLGAASLVIPVDATIDQESIARFTGSMKVYLVSSNVTEENQGKLLVIGKDGSQEDADPTMTPMGHFWQAPEETEFIFENNPEFRSLVTDIEKMRPGVLQMPFRGEQSLWTYNPVNEGVAIILVMPTRAFTKEADEAEQYVRESISTQISTVTLILGGTILTLVAVAYILSLSLSTPIRKISNAVNRVAKGDWSARADFNSSDELGELAETFNRMVPQLRERASILQALSLADEAQKNLFPEDPPQMEKVDVGARCVFSEKTGGDYYDFVGCSSCGENVFAAAIGDVSGHGVPAALLMTSARAYIRALTGYGRPLVEVVGKVNRLVTHDCMNTGHFITMLTAICDTEKMEVRWIRAGHDPGLLYNPATDEFRELIGPGMALGVDPDFLFKENVTPVESGQILTLYTDGIWEAHSPAGAQFGKDSIRQLIRDNWDKPASEIVDRIHSAVGEHCEEQPLEDDCTIIVIKFL